MEKKARLIMYGTRSSTYLLFRLGIAPCGEQRGGGLLRACRFTIIHSYSRQNARPLTGSREHTYPDDQCSEMITEGEGSHLACFECCDASGGGEGGEPTFLHSLVLMRG